MIAPASPSRAALVVGHPGHELRLFHWLERARPVVCVITDGSGSGRSRIRSSFDLIASSGSTPGPVMGAFTDAGMYDAMMDGNVAAAAAMTESIAGALIEHGVRYVVADAFEFYNPTHDLCSVIATLAAMRTQAATGLAVERYDYAVTLAASGPASGTAIVLDLDAADVQRKVAAAYAFENLTSDVDELLATIGRQEIAREILRPVSMSLDLPVPVRKPHYETHGETRVASGRYRTVLRYDRHFVPFVQALAAAFGHAVIAETQPASIS
jgi:hypothetical protein